MSPARRRGRPASGFTLVEILVAILVFTMVSVAMVGILATATRVFEEGETARAANDEAMGVFALLDGDLERAIPAAQGGHCYAAVLDDGTGNCVVGWTILNPDPTERGADGGSTRFVVWGVDGGDQLVRRELAAIPDTGALAAPASLLAGGEVVTRGCLHFGAWLAGTSHDAPLGTSRYPERDRAWTTMAGVDDTGAPYAGWPAEPRDPSTFYSTNDTWTLPGGATRSPRYPLAIRFTVILAGSTRYAKRGIVVDDDGASRLRVAGIQGIPTLAGSLVRVGDELVGYHAHRDGWLTINTDWSHGPLGAGGTGRGVYRSTPATHARGTEVRFGRQYVLARVLPQ